LSEPTKANVSESNKITSDTNESRSFPNLSLNSVVQDPPKERMELDNDNDDESTNDNSKILSSSAKKMKERKRFSKKTKTQKNNKNNLNNSIIYESEEE